MKFIFGGGGGGDATAVFSTHVGLASLFSAETSPPPTNSD